MWVASAKAPSGAQAWRALLSSACYAFVVKVNLLVQRLRIGLILQVLLATHKWILVAAFLVTVSSGLPRAHCRGWAARESASLEALALEGVCLGAEALVILHSGVGTACHVLEGVLSVIIA